MLKGSVEMATVVYAAYGGAKQTEVAREVTAAPVQNLAAVGLSSLACFFFNFLLVVVETPTSLLAMLPVGVPTSAGKDDRAVWVGRLSSSLHDSRRSCHWRRADHLCRRLHWRRNGLITCSLFGRRSSPTSARRDLILTDSFSVSMVFTKSERAGAVRAVTAKERDVVR